MAHAIDQIALVCVREAGIDQGNARASNKSLLIKLDCSTSSEIGFALSHVQLSAYDLSHDHRVFFNSVQHILHACMHIRYSIYVLPYYYINRYPSIESIFLSCIEIHIMYIIHKDRLTWTHRFLSGRSPFQFLQCRVGEAVEGND